MENLKEIKNFIDERRPVDMGEYDLMFGDAFKIAHDSEDRIHAVHTAYLYGFVWGIEYAKNHK